VQKDNLFFSLIGIETCSAIMFYIVAIVHYLSDASLDSSSSLNHYQSTLHYSQVPIHSLDPPLLDTK
jgi:hypothetical protein